MITDNHLDEVHSSTDTLPDTPSTESQSDSMLPLVMIGGALTAAGVGYFVYNHLSKTDDGNGTQYNSGDRNGADTTVKHTPGESHIPCVEQLKNYQQCCIDCSTTECLNKCKVKISQDCLDTSDIKSCSLVDGLAITS